MKTQKLEDDLMTITEVQKQFGLSRSTLWRWMAHHGLPVIKVGSWTRIRRSVLEKWLRDMEPK